MAIEAAVVDNLVETGRSAPEVPDVDAAVVAVRQHDVVVAVSLGASGA